jgi:enterochelin esterase family protein
MRTLLLIGLLVTTLPVAAQTLQSHQVNADGSLTFRYQNSGATKVSVDTDATLKPLAMERDDKGLWSVTTPPLPPEYYSYDFNVDGVEELDPLNNHVVPNLIGRSNYVLVPGHPAEPWELMAIPHGDVTRYVYTTHVAKNLPAGQEAYLVYTPPGYSAKRKGGYPVLYLLHGWTDNEAGWTAVGRANLMLDSMLNEHKIVPMIVVMPLGYGNYDFVTSGGDVWHDTAKIDENVSLDSQMLLSEILPAVEREYNVAKGRENRAIAGLSMGGDESLTIGLKHADQFAWVGGFSAAVMGDHFNERIPNVSAKQANLRLLWVACGTSDGLIAPNREFVAWARTKGLPVTAIETPGKHTWLVWRDNLLHFAPLLFR